MLEIRHLLEPAQVERVEDLLGARVDEGGFFIYVGLRGEETIGYAVVVSQIGKVKPITHIVGVTPQGTVGRAAVMIYRESHGAEVADRNFMAQYLGKSLEDPIRVDFDVVNIAGATLSGHALCKGVRKSLAVVTGLLLEAPAAEREALLAKAEDVTPEALLEAPQVVAYEAGHLRLEREVMGTVCAVEAYAGPSMSEAELEAAVGAALDEVARWDDVLSDWRDDTPLSSLNETPKNEPATVPGELLAWLRDARSWSRRTNGAFDPTVGALVDVWGLRSRTPHRPGRMALKAARRSSGVELLELDTPPGTATRKHVGLRIDPGASGKGWALDRAAEVLAARGVERALLSFRSTLKALDPPPGQQGWEVPIVHDGEGDELTRISLANQALSVSGGSLHAFEDDGVLRGHVIDPRVGEPVPAERLAWVLHDSASASDALATALLVDGEALPLIDGALGGYWAEDATELSLWGSSP